MSDWLDGTIKRVRDFDATRPRSVQAEVGWSEVGGCRSHIGYRLSGTWASDGPDTWAAQRGTALHTYLLEILSGPGVTTEVDTEYRGIPGHADLVEYHELTDIKTTRMANAGRWANDPEVLWGKRVQVHGYAAGLIARGKLHPTATVRLLVVPVDGTFADWWAWEEPFDRSLADAGADRLAEVESALADGRDLPKDEPYAWCSSYCEFFTLCRGSDKPDASEDITDPELVGAVAAYAAAHETATAAEKDKERLATVIRGLRGTAGGWRVGLTKAGASKTVLNEDAVYADYAERGQLPPTVTSPGSAPKLSVRRIGKAAAS